jgi:hypothetical protein
MLFRAEEIAEFVRQIDAALDRGKNLETACAERGVGEQTYYRWRIKLKQSPAPLSAAARDLP